MERQKKESMSVTGGSPASRRWPGLDGLRGLAAISVLLFHYVTRFDELYGPRPDMGFDFHLGTYGAEFFFVVSGLVLPPMLGKRSAREFLVARAWRLWPTFAVALLLASAVLVAYGGLPPVPTLPQVLVNLTMAPALFGTPFVDGAYWTLLYQWLFAFWLVAVYAAGAEKRLDVIAGAWATGFALHEVLLEPYGYGSQPLSTLALGPSLFYLMAGVVLGEALRDGLTAKRLAILAWIPALTAVTWGLEPAGIVVGSCVILAASVRGLLPILEARPLKRLGAISYPLYVSHQAIGFVILDVGLREGLPSVPIVALAMLVALGLAELLHRFVEEPAAELSSKRRRPAAEAPRRDVAA
jgi:peptidoglycan/LPS O-acetylase OafA/YrhL